MSHRTLLISAVLAAGASLAGLAQADIVAVDSGIAVRESDGVAPARGMTMSQVASKFGDPVSKVPAIGNPPISRWEYPGFVVYFERDHVIHSVVSGSAPSRPEGAPQASPAESPAASEAAPAPPPAEPAAAAAPASVAAPAAPAAPAVAPAAAAELTAAPPAAAEPVEPPPAP
jgi:hypothetical protein